jgi:hypothetical protein
MSEQVKTEQSDQPIIAVKEAVKLARDHLLNLIGEQPRLLLEEVELSDDGNRWLITFGYDTNRPMETDRGFGAFGISHPKYVRDYKVIELGASDGEFLSMKIRKI